MAHPLHHARSSARKYGGTAACYQIIHDWFDASKAQMAHFNHRALCTMLGHVDWASAVTARIPA